MPEILANFHVPTAAVKHRARAVYYPTPEGGLRLARVEEFSRPVFTEDGWEASKPLSRSPKGEAQGASALANVRRAVRRAKINAFDAILCNQDMDFFATLTYSPEEVNDKSDYAECYHSLNTFFSNRVQRRGLKYVCAPERTKAGDIHFHMICNSSALDIRPALSPYTGRPLIREKKPLYNVADWRMGFSSGQMITGEDGSSYDRVAKYIFKYIGKDINTSKVGGRYLLMGGDLRRPVVVLGDSADELINNETPRFVKDCEVFDAGIRYQCRYFV